MDRRSGAQPSGRRGSLLALPASLGLVEMDDEIDAATAQTLELLTRKRSVESDLIPINRKTLLNGASTLLNLNCTGHLEGAIPPGTYVFLVGDSGAGKTFLARSWLAEAAVNPVFDDYDLVYDDVEYGALMDTGRYFGQNLVDRLKPPREDEDGDPVYSETIEEFYYHVHRLLDSGKPIIYVLDSMDALTSEYEGQKFEERVKAIEGGKAAKGDYGDGKAKKNASGIRQILRKLRATGSILVIINQTRDNIGSNAMFNPKTRSGGHALTFYATLEIWMQVGKKITKTVQKQTRQIGSNVKVKLKKNRASGRLREFDLIFYYSHGFDDIGACVQYLADEHRWPSANGRIKAVDLVDDGKARTPDQLIKYIEDNDLEFDVRQLVKEVFDEIEEGCKVERKSRYQ